MGKGSVFTVSVPIAPADKPSIEAPVVPFAQPSLSTGKLVLVVDDDPLVLESMSGIFCRWGCKVITANSDTEALKVATERQQVPDLIVSDYSLANGRNGIETIEWLRGQMAAQIPAFLISGDTDPATLLEAKNKGYHLLHKPVDPMALRSMFQQAIKRSSAATVHTRQLVGQPKPDNR